MFADDNDDAKSILMSKLPIPFVMSRHGHDGASAVAGEAVVGDPDWNLLAVDGIDGVSTGEYTGFFLRQLRAFQIALARGVFAVILDGNALFLGDDFIHQTMFRRKHHIG